MSSDRLKLMKERSKIRRQLLAQQFGTKDETEIGSLLGNPTAVGSSASSSSQLIKRRLSSSKEASSAAPMTKAVKVLIDNNSDSRSEDGKQPSDEEVCEEVYTDSSTFLKGTQSLNPHNDYCQHFVDTLQRPQNFIRDTGRVFQRQITQLLEEQTGLADRFEEYPKLKELIRLKDEIISQRATPPMYLQADLETFDLRDLESKFSVIHIDPPLEEYQRRCPGLIFTWRPWNWDEIIKLDVNEVAAQRSFVFLWCGSAEGLLEGRKCLKAWGFRRCEDICWIKTNKQHPGNTKYMEPKAILQHTKEHCLMGIKGTVRRSTDGDFIHANVDLDIIITEEPEFGSTEKPTEIFHMIEHFCLGRRRLDLFGNDSRLRPGWLTVGPDLSSSNYSSDTYNSYFNATPTDNIVGSTQEIETLRPKSPPNKAKNAMSRGGGRGRGRGDQGGQSMGGRGGMRGGMGGPPRGGGFGGRGGHFPGRGGYTQR